MRAVRCQAVAGFRFSLDREFDPGRSDVDFVVEFEADRENIFHDYFDLKSALEQIVGRDVDLVMANAVKNPYIAKSIFDSAEDVYAA
ncbi:nucleotidyltransferase family protein [Gordonia rubripertincta]|uniref:nucleotidyltransferase family protein n=1 Tax=Gordonia rubripertincta TaxID=36822 RepID=UPI0035ADADE3